MHFVLVVGGVTLLHVPVGFMHAVKMCTCVHLDGGHLDGGQKWTVAVAKNGISTVVIWTVAKKWYLDDSSVDINFIVKHLLQNTAKMFKFIRVRDESILVDGNVGRLR